MKNPQEGAKNYTSIDAVMSLDQTTEQDRQLLRREVTHFRFGGKLLKLFAHMDTATFSTYIENVDSNHTEGETTLLYKEVLKKMQEIADRDQHTYVYELRTENGRMKSWAEGPGREVFHWTATEKKYLDNGEVLDIFHTEIAPKP